ATPLRAGHATRVARLDGTQSRTRQALDGRRNRRVAIAARNGRAAHQHGRRALRSGHRTQAPSDRASPRHRRHRIPRRTGEDRGADVRQDSTLSQSDVKTVGRELRTQKGTTELRYTDKARIDTDIT